VHPALATRRPGRILCGLKFVHQGSGSFQRVLQPAATLDPVNNGEYRRPDRFVAPHDERQRKHFENLHFVPADHVRGNRFRTGYHLHAHDWRATAGTQQSVADDVVHGLVLDQLGSRRDFHLIVLLCQTRHAGE